MIKNWKSFNESLENEPDLNELKNEMINMFEPFFEIDKKVRPIASKDVIEETAEDLINMLVTKFRENLVTTDFSNIMKQKLELAFIESAKISKPKMINSSFKSGMILLLDSLLPSIREIKSEIGNEGWLKDDSNEDDQISNLRKSELNDLINAALDKRDFDRVKYLSKFIKESYGDLSKLSKFVNNYMFKLFSYIDNYVKI